MTVQLRLALTAVLFFSPLVFLSLAWGPSPARAQVQAHERGNCFHWAGCRGDSIGATLIESPASCATLGGKSWADATGMCHSFSGGPQGQFPDNYSKKKVHRLPPRR